MGACATVAKQITFESIVSGNAMSSSSGVSKTHRLTQNIVKVNLTRDIHEFYEIEEDNILGSGMNGDVRSCVHKSTKRKYALKRLVKAEVSPENLHQLRGELSCMAYLDHPGILRVFEVFESENYLCLVLELCTGGNLLDRMREQYNHRFHERDACHYIHSILSAVAYCHAHNVVHRDLKLENVLFEDESKGSKLKIIGPLFFTSPSSTLDHVISYFLIAIYLLDFGLSKTHFAPKRMHSICGTGEYVAPEVLKGTCKYYMFYNKFRIPAFVACFH